MNFRMLLAISQLVPDEHSDVNETGRFEEGNRMITAFNNNRENDAYKAFYAKKWKFTDVEK